MTQERVIDARIFIPGLNEDYKIVHQGGHHNVYCNGEAHIWTDGGFCHPERGWRKVSRRGRCDCATWESKITNGHIEHGKAHQYR